MAGGGSGARVRSEYVLTVLSDGKVQMAIYDGWWWEVWTYERWEHLLTTQTFSPYARVFVRGVTVREGLL